MRRLPALFLAASALAGAQEPVRVGGYLQAGYLKTLGADLRDHLGGSPYYLGSGSFRPEWREDGFLLRRVAVQVSGGLAPSLSFMVATLPTLTTTPANPSILQDAFITWQPLPGLEVRLGQFKALQTYEGFSVRTVELPFTERSQLARRFGIQRERGLGLFWRFQAGPGLEGRLGLGVFNGTYEENRGKGADRNAGKDMAGRLEFRKGPHRFGAYGLSGGTDQAQAGRKALAFAGQGAPPASAVLADGDRTAQLGAFYVFEERGWHASAEVVGGRLGRRFPALGREDGPALREHLAQRFLGHALTVGVTLGHHRFALRHDHLDYNAGRDWYGPVDPYRDPANGTDLTPAFTEVSGSWTFSMGPAGTWIRLYATGRSRNFLAPEPGETGARGGSTAGVMVQTVF